MVLGLALSVALAAGAVLSYDFYAKPRQTSTHVEYAGNAPLFFENPQAFGHNVLPPDYLDMSGEQVDKDEEQFGDVSADDFVNYASPA